MLFIHKLVRTQKVCIQCPGNKTGCHSCHWAIKRLSCIFIKSSTTLTKPSTNKNTWYLEIAKNKAVILAHTYILLHACYAHIHRYMYIIICKQTKCKHLTSILPLNPIMWPLVFTFTHGMRTLSHQPHTVPALKLKPIKLFCSRQACEGDGCYHNAADLLLIWLLTQPERKTQKKNPHLRQRKTKICKDTEKKQNLLTAA